MPNCFQLIRKSNPANGPVSLNGIDDEMRKHFGAKPDPEKYYAYWFDHIGFPLAMGKSFADIREQFKRDADAEKPEGEAYWKRMLAIVDWLDANFTSDAFATIGK